MMKVISVWYLEAMPLHAVVETQDRQLHKFAISPFRDLKESDLTAYAGPHPRQIKGQPMPEHLYRFYGLEKDSETMSEVLKVRMTPREKQALDAYAKSQGKKVADIIRDFVGGL